MDEQQKESRSMVLPRRVEGWECGVGYDGASLRQCVRLTTRWARLSSDNSGDYYAMTFKVGELEGEEPFGGLEVHCYFSPDVMHPTPTASGSQVSGVSCLYSSPQHCYRSTSQTLFPNPTQALRPAACFEALEPLNNEAIPGRIHHMRSGLGRLGSWSATPGLKVGLWRGQTTGGKACGSEQGFPRQKDELDKRDGLVDEARGTRHSTPDIRVRVGSKTSSARVTVIVFIDEEPMPRFSTGTVFEAFVTLQPPPSLYRRQQRYR
ncbi:hypothetical protein GALMADRAFT_229099 [Galerina marginata CBS 339.88]|uniref:Uncharacterized protein n=1 Tax=Galerina marginata (strain CBS 339.88) TaxID=685588 RepID=A0A067SZU9_GALM3|nr:hypothetical protein GALMADRAFT_229099 [Galerina marginata CBS 339.88]